MTAKKENQIVKILNYKPPMSVKDIKSRKSLTDRVTQAISEEECDLQDGVRRKKDISFSPGAYENVVFHIQGKYTDPNIKLSPVDKAVYDAVCTLYENGFDVQTPQQIYEITTGKKYSSKPGQKKLVEESMYHLLCTFLLLTVEDKEIKLRAKSPAKYPRDIKGMKKSKNNPSILYKKGLCLYGEEAGIVGKNNTEISAYKIHNIGIGGYYADGAKQVQTISRESYSLPDGIKATRNNIALRTVLLAVIHYNKPGITVKKLFEKAGIEGTVRQNEKLFKTIDKILDTWKSQNLIKDYHYEKKGRNNHHKLVIKKMPVKRLKKGGQNG